MAVKTAVHFGCRAFESRVLGTASGAGQINWSLIDQIIALHEGTTPDIDDIWASTVALSAGTVTLALDGLTSTGMTSKDWTGKRVIFFAIHNRGANTMLAAGAAATPYELFGGATDQMTIPAGGYVQAYSPTGFGTVTASISDITVTGTGVQTFDILMLAGTP